MSAPVISIARAKATSASGQIAKGLREVATELEPKEHGHGLSTLPADVRKAADFFERVRKDGAEGTSSIEDDRWDAVVRLCDGAAVKSAELTKNASDLRRATELVSRIALAQQAAAKVDQILDLAIQAVYLLRLGIS